MASGPIFFSSPPHPTSNTWQPSTTPFFTPQKPPNRHVWPTVSPSPLRTSRNANLMSPPARSGGGGGKAAQQQHEDDDDNTTIVADKTTTTAFFLGPPAPRPASHFSARAHASSPSAQLHTHAAAARASRKHRFLERLRTRRDEARGDRAVDQVLRMDYLAERARWEAEKRRGAGAGAGDDDGLVDVDVDVEREEEEENDEEELQMSPVDEERELEEMADLYRRTMQDDGFGDFGGDDDDDEVYDEVFWEVLERQEGMLEGQKEGEGQKQFGNGGVDAEMDMS